MMVMFKEFIEFRRMKWNFPPAVRDIYERYNLVLFYLDKVEDSLKRHITPVYTIQNILSETSTLISDTLSILKNNSTDGEVVKKAEKQFSTLVDDIDETIELLGKSIAVGEPSMISARVTLLLPKIKKHINFFIKPIFENLKPELNKFAEEKFVEQAERRLGIVPEKEEEELPRRPKLKGEEGV
jgi:hypothetical protein